MTTPKKLYHCPRCGDTLTDAEYEALLEVSGNGYCLCQFTADDRIFVGYDIYVLQPRVNP